MFLVFPYFPEFYDVCQIYGVEDETVELMAIPILRKTPDSQPVTIKHVAFTERESWTVKSQDLKLVSTVCIYLNEFAKK